MKTNFILISIVIFVSFIASCGKTVSTEPDRIKPEEKRIVKVMTYNIWGAQPGGIPEGGLQALADIIKRADPDLVALQEVDKFTTRNAIHGDIAKELGKLTGMNHFFAKAMNFYGGEYGDAILSKYPIKETKSYTLGTTPQLMGEMRSVARVTVDVGGKDIYFISTHFDHLVDEANRLYQARSLVDIIANYDKPVIVGADFNARPETATIEILKEKLYLGCKNNTCSQFTFSTFKPDRTIDYLMYAPLNAMNVVNYSVYTYATKESDHFPVVATFEIK